MSVETISCGLTKRVPEQLRRHHFCGGKMLWNADGGGWGWNDERETEGGPSWLVGTLELIVENAREACFPRAAIRINNTYTRLFQFNEHCLTRLSNKLRS